MRKLIRRGECARCGECCTYPDGRTCEYLTEAKLCSCQSYKPALCAKWPTHPSDFVKHPCKHYHFYDAETGVEVNVPFYQSYGAIE